MSWALVPLSEIADFQLGKMLDKRKNKGELRPYLANLDVRWGEISLRDLRQMRFEDRELERFSLQAGDIVMCEGGEPGRCAIWRDEVPGMMYQKALHRIRTGPGVDTRYLFYVFLHMGQADLFEPYFTGSTIKHMPRAQLARVKVPLPPLPIQRRIAAILSAYDDLIEVNTRRIAILEEMARRIYEAWFVHGADPAWERVPLQNLYRTSSGGTPSRSQPEYYDPNGIPWVKTKELKDGPVHETEEKISALGLSKSSAKLFPPDTVLLAMYGATIGRVGVLQQDAACNQACCAILPTAEGPGWEYAYLTLLARRNELIDLRVGAAQQNISQAIIKGFEIVHAPKEVHEDFENRVEPMLRLAFLLARQNANLRAQRDLLLPRLVSGKLDVSALDAAEEELADA